MQNLYLITFCLASPHLQAFQLSPQITGSWKLCKISAGMQCHNEVTAF